MNVLVVTNMYPTAAEPSFGSFVEDQVNALARLGVNVEVIQFDGRTDRRAYLRAGLAVRARCATGDVDVVHAHYGLTGAIARLQRRVPVITTFHGSDTGYVRWQARLSWFVARTTTPIFVSRASAKRLRVKDAYIVPAGIDLTRFEPSSRMEARRKLNWPEAPRYVLLPGARGNPVKRADFFDAAVAQVAELRGDVRGVTLEGYARECVPTVLNAVDAVLMTSDFEGAPVTVKEALACNTPVVSVPVGDVGEVLDGLPGCSVVDRSAPALASAVGVAIDTPRSDALRERASEYSAEIIAQRIADIYESVVEGKVNAEA